MEQELAGLTKLARGDQTGLGQLRQAAQREDKMAYAFGPPSVLQPSHELLGEELLRLSHPADAETEFRSALKRTPGRVQALAGLAQSLRAAGKRAAADSVGAVLARIREPAAGPR
jgi:hypothetical protein